MSGKCTSRWLVAMVAVVAVLGFGLWARAAEEKPTTEHVRGKVVDVNDKPVEGATVHIHLVGEREKKHHEPGQEAGVEEHKTTVTTGRDGEFVLHDVVPGEYRVTAEKKGWGAGEAHVTVGGERPPLVTIMLKEGHK